ncbi:MAG TPA: hypothetical protein VHE61_13505 [Opitutaceae bacterium]|nr:hypothetical protein [Opitutaceae bacterium]
MGQRKQTQSSELTLPEPKSPGLRRLLRPLLWSSPYRYWLFGMVRQRKNILSRQFDLLIDGYPRSANTFAVYTFKTAQHRETRISSHHHNPAAVVAAIRMRKPVLVLARDPIDAVASWTVFSGYPLKYNLETYINYYSELLKYKGSFEVGEFGEVTKQFPFVIDRLNRRFGTKFETPVVDLLNPKRIFEAIERNFEIENGYVDENRVSRPSEQRELFKRTVREELEGPDLEPLRRQATALFTAMQGKTSADAAIAAKC